MADRSGRRWLAPAAVAAGAWALAAIGSLAYAGIDAAVSSQGRKPAATARAHAHSRDNVEISVMMTDQLKFEPALRHIHVGDTVVWHNQSVLVHTVTADPAQAAKPADVHLPAAAARFDSGRLAPKASFLHTFNVPGHYRYFCIPHEAAGMVGELVVEAR